MINLTNNCHSERTNYAQQTGFTADTRVYVKMTAALVLAVLSIIAVSAISLYPSAPQAEAVSGQGMMITKTDRNMRELGATSCETQAWGAWSADCAAALTGASKVRKVSFVTVEKPAKTVNETILARYAVFE